MKFSLALVLAGSLLAAANPIDKRRIYTDYVTDLVVVTVTVDEPITHYFSQAYSHPVTTTTSSSTSTSTSSTYIAPPPPPTTSSTSTSTSSTSTSSIVVETPTPTPEAPTTTTIVAPTTSSSTLIVIETPSPTPTPVADEAALVVTVAVNVKTSSPLAAAKTSTTAAAAAAVPTDYSSTAIYHHNLHRANHSAPAASWDSDLASYAATVASSCVYGHDLTPGGGGYGQNIAMTGSSSASSSDDASKYVAQATTNMWYNGEVWQFPGDSYGQDTPDMDDFESWGHFSQVVWAASTSVGCATQFCPAGTMNAAMAAWFTVCNYRSTGNVGGSYGLNVLPSLGKASITA